MPLGPFPERFRGRCTLTPKRAELFWRFRHPTPLGHDETKKGSNHLEGKIDPPSVAAATYGAASIGKIDIANAEVALRLLFWRWTC